MAFRLTYRRQCRYNTKRNKQHLSQSCGGERRGLCDRGSCDIRPAVDPYWISYHFTCDYPVWLCGTGILRRVVKTPGGRAVFQTLKKKAKGPHCGDCSSVDLYNAIERRESVCLKKQNFEVNCSALLSFGISTCQELRRKGFDWPPSFASHRVCQARAWFRNAYCKLRMCAKQKLGRRWVSVYYMPPLDCREK